MRLVLILASFIAGVTATQCFANEIKADPTLRVKLSGVLSYDGRDYSLKLKEPIFCSTSDGKEELVQIYIGVGGSAGDRYKFLKSHVNSMVTLSGVVDDPRGACVFYDVKF